MNRAETRHIKAMLTLATESDIQQGTDWYERASRFADRLSQAYGCSPMVAAGVIAAISPNVSWTLNQRSAETMIKAWSVGVDPMSVKVCGYPVMRQKAADILSLEPSDSDIKDKILSILNGPKISSFFKCIVGDQKEVCVDGHALSVFLGERILTSKTPSISPKLYTTVQRAYAIISARSEEICGTYLSPAQVQAVTWVTYRRVYSINQ